jgi:peptide-methionine (S)-S-oxide reductase
VFRSLFADKSKVPSAADALPGRSTPMPVSGLHPVLRSSLTGPWDGTELAMFGLGCFWGAERIFWKLPGVVSTQVGYAAGSTPNPTYREVCSGQTGHNEVVRVVFNPAQITYAQLLKTFWEAHDPTQGMRQGNDQGTQYRSGVYCYGEAQLQAAEQSRAVYQAALRAAGRGTITTEVIAAPAFYFAEDYHQQYLHKNPGGYCGIGGTGVSCPEGLGEDG